MPKDNIVTLQGRLYKKNARIQETGREEGDDYKDILDKITQKITDNHSRELAEGLYSESTMTRLKNLINRYLLSEKLVQNETSIGTLTDRIYEDMAGIGFVKKYLEDPEVEEININGKDSIWVLYGNRKVKAPEKFETAEDCINVVKKMARMGGLILDGSTPLGDSYLSKGVRMSAAIFPAVDEDAGAIASIRKQKPSFITRENLISFETASSNELDFLTLCLNNNIPVAVAGPTGSGKTADVNYLLNSVDKSIRIVTIEDTKELLPESDDVVQLYTKEAPNEITMNDHLKLSLRLHPSIFVPAEMRGKEAQTAVEAARTGHTALTTLHANGARNAYLRILTMYRQADAALSEDTILRMIIEAFPIMLFKKQMPDKSRKYIEIFEATDVVEGKVVGNTIFKFMPTKTDVNDEGKIIKIHGKHEMIGGISERLADTFLLNGVSEETVKQYRI
ncbi:CpaF family protein [Aminipila butyrica]|uniref:CpaF family protein n=1 Tax=Aminipila butyrica TaxID=433296 RepID=A0A858BXE1_9FIRM|nr:ATPase, T2SS/T4P/T4SS family [Aminipila butyrica]QIB69778.1 CpaF family protein [Aminipila butyrica]